MAAWYPFYWDDYVADTRHLSLMEHGAYKLLMAHYYCRGKPLPANAMQLQRICTCTSPAELDAMEKVIKEFFILEDGCYKHNRIDQELEKSNKISDKRREAAKKRHSAEYANAPANAPANAHPQAHTTTTTVKDIKERPSVLCADAPDIEPNAQPKTQKTHLNGDARFDEWWMTLPKTMRINKKRCREIWRRKHLDQDADELIADITERMQKDQKWIDGYMPRAPAYLNGHRWEDTYQTRSTR